MISYVYSLKGGKHNVNQDSYIINEEKSLYMIADGMGGYMSGEVASRIACGTISENINDFSKEAIKNAIAKANEEIYLKGKEKENKGMGTTIALCLIKGDEMYAAHVGDSRIYTIAKKAKSITKDHSLVEELLERGEITEAEAEKHTMKNVITRAVGADSKVSPDIIKLKLKENEKILICSDGMCKNISLDDIAAVFASTKSENIPKVLCETALKNGSTDDITVMTIHFNQGDEIK